MERSPSTPLPIGTLTFLLTDIVGSTALWEAAGAAMREAVRRHHALIAEAVARHGGRQPLEQGEGDSTVSVFTRASDAAEAALDVQRSLRTVIDGDPVQISVRMGMHTGEAEFIDDTTYGGPTIARTARLRGLAAGGQILVSASAAALLADSAPAGVTLLDLGEHPLRGLSRPERVFQLCHVDVAADFPPLPATACELVALPVVLTSFVGRVSQRAELARVITDERLVTLTGAGGCGKTRLAIEVARDVSAGFADGVHFVDLGPLTDPTLVPKAVAMAVGAPEPQGLEIAEALARHLDDRNVLVVLDNCEHLADAAAEMVERLLHRCPDLSVLATSREPLNVPGECSWLVPSLSLPGADDTTPGRIAAAEAVALFVERAQRVRPGFTLSEDNAGVVATICRRLDGVPLALELAAARIRSLTVQQIADGLADRFRLLTGGARSSLPRQRTLEASVDWSHDLLGHDEQRLFRRLAVFAGGFDLAAAEDVCCDDVLTAVEVLELLTRLVERSLVLADDGRYRLLETVRDYARHKLVDAAEAASLRNRHLDHYVRLAEQAEPTFWRVAPAEQVANLWTALTADYDNLRAAMDWSVESRQVDEALALAANLQAFWMVKNHLREARLRAEAALALPGGDPALRALALVSAAMGGSRHADGAAESVSRLEEALAIARAVDDDRAIRRTLAVLGWLLTLRSGSAGRVLLEEAIERTREGDPSCHAHALTSLALLNLCEGRSADAADLFEAAIAAARSTNNPYLVQRATFWCAFQLAMRGELEALALLEESLRLSREASDTTYLAMGLAFRAMVHVQHGNYQQAETDARAALAVAYRTDISAAAGTAQMALCTLHQANGQPAAAREAAERSLAIQGDLRQTHTVFAGRVVAAKAAASLGDVDGARRHAAQLLEAAERTGFPMNRGRAQLLFGMLEADAGRPDAAEPLFTDSVCVLVGAGSVVDAVDAVERLAMVATDLGDHIRAARLLGAAESARRSRELVRHPVDHPAYDAALCRLREELGEAAFDQACSEGAAMPLDEVSTYVMRGRGTRARPRVGWASLTPTEREVVELVTAGLSNKEIAARLFVSARTVQTHVAHVFAKLGMRSRTQLATAALALQADPPMATRALS